MPVRPRRRALQAGEELRYTLILSTRPAGHAVLRSEANGESLLTLDVGDRGRGQSLTARMTLDDAGIPAALHVTGVDYWQNPVDERFERREGRAVWSGAFEHGEARPAAAAFYVSQQTDLGIGLLATALLNAPGGRLPLLPQARPASSPRARCGCRRGRPPQRPPLRPLRSWLHPGLRLDGRPGLPLRPLRRFHHHHPRGLGSGGLDLVQAQGRVALERSKALATRLARSPKHGLAIRGARLFDPLSGTSTAGSTVVIAADRIGAVGPTARCRPPGAEIVDAGGKALLPACGTCTSTWCRPTACSTSRPASPPPATSATTPTLLLELRRCWDAGEALGPRLLMGASSTAPAPTPRRPRRWSPPNARRWPPSTATPRLGCVQIKLYSSLDPKLVPGSSPAPTSSACGCRGTSPMA